MHVRAKWNCRRATALRRDLLVTAFLLLAGGRVAVAQSPLRYPLDEGEYLQYDLRVRLGDLRQPNAGVRETAEQVRCWVLEKQADSRTLLLEHVQLNAVGETQTLGGALFQMDSLGAVHIAADFEAEIPRLDWALQFFPPGPHALSFEVGWVSDPDVFGRSWRCAPAGPDPAHERAPRVDLTSVDATGVSDFLRESAVGAFWFDPERGGLTRLETLALRPTIQERRELVALLRERSTVKPAWLEKRRMELARYLKVLRLQAVARCELLTGKTDADRLLERLDRAWSEFDREFIADAESPIRRLGAAARTELAGASNHWKQLATLAAQWVGKPAGDWSLLNEKGATVESRTFRGAPTIEFLWDTHTPDGLRMFPALQKLQEHNNPQQLRLICLNVDADAPAARRAIERVGPGLPHVLLGPPLGGDPLPETPIARCLDAQGVVRGLIVGWTPHLCDRAVEFLGAAKEMPNCR